MKNETIKNGFNGELVMKNQIKETAQNTSDRQTLYLPDALPKMIKREVFLTYKISGYQAGMLEIRDFDYCGDDRVIIAKQLVTLNISAKLDLKSMVIETLKEEKEKVQAESYKKIAEIDNRINQLLVIEYQPTEAV